MCSVKTLRGSTGFHPGNTYISLIGQYRSLKTANQFYRSLTEFGWALIITLDQLLYTCMHFLNTQVGEIQCMPNLMCTNVTH